MVQRNLEIGVNRRQSAGNAETRRLFSRKFLSRVGRPAPRYPKVMKLKDMPKFFTGRMMRLVDIAMAEGVVDMSIGVMQEVVNQAPVWTGTWVANYRISLAPSVAFDLGAAFYPTVVAGTSAAGAAKRRPITRALRDAKPIVSTLYRKRGGVFYLVNPTPYRTRHEYYTSGSERQQVGSARSRYGLQLRSAVGRRMRELDRKVRI